VISFVDLVQKSLLLFRDSFKQTQKLSLRMRYWFCIFGGVLRERNDDGEVLSERGRGKKARG
jgi:hypothetical protein